MDELLRIYLNDQLALGILWRELAERAAEENRGSDVGAALDDVATGIAEDVATFEEIMARLGVRRSAVKPVLATAAERVARLKLNGRVRGYSPLSRFIELDVLAMGIDGKKLLWTTLRDLAGLGTRLPDVDFAHLIERATWQRDRIEPFRCRAGLEALGGSQAPPEAGSPS